MMLHKYMKPTCVTTAAKVCMQPTLRAARRTPRDGLRLMQGKLVWSVKAWLFSLPARRHASVQSVW